MRLILTICCVVLLMYCHPKATKGLIGEEVSTNVDTVASSISSQDLHAVQLDEVILEPPPLSPDTLMFYKQSGCLGKCPVFEFVVWNDGHVEYNGKRNIKYTGKHQLKLREDQLEEVSLWLPNYRLAQLDKRYPRNLDDWIPDLPSSTTIWKNGPQSGSISHNHSAPQNYVQFEKVVLAWVQNLPLSGQ